MTTTTFVCRAILLAMALFVVYPYTIYPLCLWILCRFRRHPWKKADSHPRLSIIIAAHNEEEIIESKIANTLALDYPRHRLEILVASDCSTDRTDEIVRNHGYPVRLIRLENRSGKQVALNRAVEEATGEILLFTDAAVFVEPWCAKRLTRNFADPRVGAVSSVIHISAPKATNGSPQDAGVAFFKSEREAEGAYLDLDLAIRKMEADLGSAVGLCGSCYAIRRKCFIPFDPGACNDFLSALDAVKLGYRAVVDEEAIGYMLPAKNHAGEFRRKARTIAGGIDTLWRSGALRSGHGHPIYWWELISHKVARWMGPPALLPAAIVSVVGALDRDPLLSVFAALGFLGLSLAAVGFLAPAAGKIFLPFRLASFALIAWLACFWGWVQFLGGARQVVWTPTTR
ncbi:MAG: glycosyltransferase family 2 protein [Planctomycetota bacterium]